MHSVLAHSGRRQAATLGSAFVWGDCHCLVQRKKCLFTPRQENSVVLDRNVEHRRSQDLQGLGVKIRSGIDLVDCHAVGEAATGVWSGRKHLGGRMPVSGAVSIGGRTPWVENDSRHRVQVPPPKSGRPVHGWWHDGVPSQHDGKDAAAAVNRLEVRR